VGFAIPSNTVARIANQLIGGHKVAHAYVGVSLVSNSAGGAQIGSGQSGHPAVVPDTPGAKAGLKPHDLIVAVNGQTITTTDQFIAYVDSFSPGQTVTMTVQRAGQTLHVKVKLGTRPASTPSGG
jgi:putative serine protease PepD